MSLLKIRLLFRNQPIVTKCIERHVQGFSKNKVDNTPHRDHVVILPEPLDESSNSLLKLNKVELGVIDLSCINGEIAFKGLSQTLVQYENFLVDVNNGTLTFNNLQDLIDEIQTRTFCLDTAYNTVCSLIQLDHSKLRYNEIFELIERVRKAKSEKFWSYMKDTIQPFYNNEPPTSQLRKMIDYYKIQAPSPTIMRPEDITSVESLKSFIIRDATAINRNIFMANQLFSHTVDDPDILAGISDASDDSVDQHHKRRTPLKVTVDTYQKFMEVCPDRFIRHNLWETLNKRCSPKASPKLMNLGLISNIRSLRRYHANFIGFRNHLEFRLHNSAAGSRQNILEKLDEMNQENRQQIQDRLEELEAFADDNGFSDPQKLGIREYDVDYWANKYVHDIIIGKSKSKVKTHFKLENVLKGLANYFKNYFGIEVEPIKDSIKTWNDQVRVFRFHKNNETLGNIIYDPFQRPDKKVIETVSGRLRSRNKSLNLHPLQFVSTSLKPSTRPDEVTLSVRDIISLFYSFGVATQDLLYNYDIYELNSFGGLEHDSQNLFPQLVILQLLKDHRILQSCSIREDRKPIDSDLTLRLLKAHSYFSCFKTSKDLYKARLDLEAHSTLTDIKAIVSNISPIYSPFPRDSDNYDYCSMSKIFAGPNDGRQYSYLWSKQLAKFCLSKVLSERETQELAQIDEAAIRASNESLISILYEKDNFNTNQKLTTFVGRRFQSPQSGLGVL